MKNKILSVLILLIFTFVSTNKAYAEDKPSDYEYLPAGECVKTDGFFFSEPGMANLYLAIDEKIKLAILDKQRELSIIKLDLQKCNESKQIELKIQREMFEEQLLAKQRVIDSYKSEAFWNNIKTVGYVAAGVGAGIIFGFIIANK
jgi:hypothetical protein